MCFWSLFCSYCPGVDSEPRPGRAAGDGRPTRRRSPADTVSRATHALILQPQFVMLMVYALDLVLVAEHLAVRAGVYAWVVGAVGGQERVDA